MTVADLQQHLADLAKVLDRSGAKPVAADLNAVAEGLRPFNATPLKKFSEFLIWGSAWQEGGKVLPPPKELRLPREKAIRVPKSPAPNPAELGTLAKHLYESAASPTTTIEQFDELLTRVGQLTKAGVVTVAESVGLVGMKPKSKDDILKAIRARLYDRKGATLRATM